VRMALACGPVVARVVTRGDPAGGKAPGRTPQGSLEDLYCSSLAARCNDPSGEPLTCAGGERRHAALHPIPPDQPITDQNTYDYGWAREE
jgi:hypothetical protein